MRTRSLFAGVGIALASLSLTGCGVNPLGMAQSVIQGQNTAGYSASDLMFAAMMIPHHEQAVTMSDLALTASNNAEVKHLAEHIKAAQQPEIALMQSWLDASGQGNMSSMPGHDHGAMGGMLDDAAMAALKAATGTQFDTLFLQGMIAHHQGALAMLDLVKDSSNPDVQKLAEAIRSTQTAEIEQMQQLLAALG